MAAIINPRKVAIVGCGFVGSASAFALMQSGLFSEMVLIDVDHDRAEGEALDIAHGMAFGSPMNIYAGDYSDIDDAAITVITAGANQAPGETRLDLVNKNVAIFKSIIPQIAERDYQGILLVVSNPVDILTYVALKLSGMPANRVLGSGTTLDTARFKYALGEHLGVDPRNVHARIIGEHGDSEIAAWSLANVSGIPLNDFCELRGHTDHERNMDRIAEEVKNAAYEIIKKKRATYYGIAMTVKRICEAITRDEKPILPVSNYIDGEYGLHDIVLSMPAVVGASGIEYQVPIKINETETEQLKASAATLPIRSSTSWTCSVPSPFGAARDRPPATRGRVAPLCAPVRPLRRPLSASARLIAAGKPGASSRPRLHLHLPVPLQPHKARAFRSKR